MQSSRSNGEIESKVERMVVIPLVTLLPTEYSPTQMPELDTVQYSYLHSIQNRFCDAGDTSVNITRAKLKITSIGN